MALRTGVLLPCIPLVSGRTPLSRLARVGPQTACWQYALSKSRPRRASRSILGEMMWAQVVDGDKQNVHPATPARPAPSQGHCRLKRGDCGPAGHHHQKSSAIHSVVHSPDSFAFIVTGLLQN